MESMILAYSFAAALVIAAGIVLLFSRAIDEALSRVIPPEMTRAWSQYVKFALFTVTFAGGMRLTELADFIMRRVPGTAPVGGAQGLLEVLKTVTGALIAASGTLLAFFIATLAVYASMRVYRTVRAKEENAPAAARSPERAPDEPERPPVGAVRHSGTKDRQRNGDADRFL